MTRQRTMIVGLTLLLVAGGCGKKDLANLAPGGSDGIRLISTGAEPRRKLRFSFKKGHTETAVMVMKMTTSGRKAPTMRLTMKARVTEVRSDGSARYEFEYTGAKVDPGLGSSVVQAILRKLIGTRGWAVVTTRGETTDGDIEVAPGADAQVRQQLESMKQSITQMSVPLPEEPVGLGARWKVNMTTKTPMFTLGQTGTYTIKKMTDDELQLESLIEQTAPPQEVTPPPGTEGKFELEDYSGSGSGTTTTRLNQLIPNASLKISNSLKLSQGGRSQSVSSTIEVSLRPATEPEPGARTKAGKRG